MKTARKLGMLALAALATASCLDHPLMVDPAGDDVVEPEVVERAEPLIRFFSFTYMGPGPAPVIGPDRRLVLVEEADRGWSREIMSGYAPPATAASAGADMTIQRPTIRHDGFLGELRTRWKESARGAPVGDHRR